MPLCPVPGSESAGSEGSESAQTQSHFALIKTDPADFQVALAKLTSRSVPEVDSVPVLIAPLAAATQMSLACLRAVGDGLSLKSQPSRARAPSDYRG